MSQNRRNRPIVIICLAMVGIMLGGSFAAVPLYDLFCRVTGYGGTTRVATSAPAETLEREVTVRFDGSVAGGAPLRFTPYERTMHVRLGERMLAYYEVANLSDHPVVAIASYNVSPFKSGPFFNKLECFCFTEQTFEPGERRELAVLFFVDPEMDADRRYDDVREITLSYTFFRKPGDVAGRAEEEIAGG